MEDFRLLIDGKLVAGAAATPVVNPATEEAVALCPRASKEQLDTAVAAAKRAFPAWSALSLKERSAYLVKVADAVDANAPALARLLTEEQGKPLPQSQGEVMGLSYFFRYFAGLDLEPTILEDGPGRRVEVQRRPLGVVGAIIPWNFPVALLGCKLPPALLAGNTVVVKPAPTTPLTALYFGSLIADILPPGVVNIIADDNDLGDALTSHPDIRKITFTGSTVTGKRVMASAAGTLKRVTLELGGNDAAIVLDDADPKKVAPAIYNAAFMNSGQVCLAIKRLYVHDSIYEPVCTELAALAEAAVVDDGLKQGTEMGPLQNKMQYRKVQEFLADAREHGTIVAGGEVIDRPGYFIRPTVVRDIAEGSRLVDEEQFGPVLPVIRYSDAEDALTRANASPYGLGGSVWSSDEARAFDIAQRMNTGTVWINTHLDSTPNIPFGGAKASGIGTEMGVEGLAEFTQLHVINIKR